MWLRLLELRSPGWAVTPPPSWSWPGLDSTSRGGQGTAAGRATCREKGTSPSACGLSGLWSLSLSWLCPVACLPWLLLQDPLQGWAAAGLSWVRLGRRSQAWPELNPKCEFEKNLGEMGPCALGRGSRCGNSPPFSEAQAGQWRRPEAVVASPKGQWDAAHPAWGRAAGGWGMVWGRLEA